MNGDPNGAHLIETSAERAIREQTKENSRAAKYRKLQVWFNAILTFATIVTAGIVLFQNYVLNRSLEEMRKQSQIMTYTLGEMRNQTIPMKDAATAARDSVREAQNSSKVAQRAIDLSIDTSRLDQRAWVTVNTHRLASPITAGQIPTVLIEVMNSGNTPAIEVYGAGTVFLGAEKLTPEQLLETTTGTRQSTTVIGPNATGVIAVNMLAPIQARHIKAIAAGTQRLYAKGIIYYRDIFNRQWSTGFCRYLGREEMTNPIHERLGMPACLEHNYVR